MRSQFYFTAALLYMFRVLSTPIIRSTLTVSTAFGTGHTSVQLPSSNVAEFETRPLSVFRVLSTPIIKSTLTVSTASGTAVATFLQCGRV